MHYTGHQLALIICNTPLDGVEKFLQQIWQYCSVVICADGGSNRLYDDMAPVRNRYNDEELSDVINNISVLFLM